ncbi:MAG TPA: T9SS type A sorting domain-containing protein, partial [Bacteroidia bacterium]|nr:T9SS type A sorting domain-containing protein [Bacteroidia bacterium]
VFLGSVYPNPSKGLIAIPVKTDRLTSCTIEIKNVLGQTMSCIFNGSIQGERNFFANTTSLSSGIYMVELKTAEKIMQEKIVVR